jgi:hypothetical protein
VGPTFKAGSLATKLGKAAEKLEDLSSAAKKSDGTRGIDKDKDDSGDMPEEVEGSTNDGEGGAGSGAIGSYDMNESLVREHLENGSYTRNKGVVGGHTLDEFKDTLVGQGYDLEDCLLIETPHPTIPGLYNIKYYVPVLDRLRNVVEPRSYRDGNWDPKTVYDTDVLSTDQIMEWGEEAMQNIVETKGDRVTGISSNGLRYVGYIDDDGQIKSFYPEFKNRS